MQSLSLSPRHTQRHFRSVVEFFSAKADVFSSIKELMRAMLIQDKTHTHTQPHKHTLTWGLISATALATAEHPAAKLKAPTLAITDCSLSTRRPGYGVIQVV